MYSKSRENLFIGYEVGTGKPMYIPAKYRSTGLHIIGAAGEGKTKSEELEIRQDIINDNGLCFLDLHGHAYQDIVEWCVEKRMLGRKKIILFDASEENWTFGFNPLQTQSRQISYHVNWMIKAIEKAWGGTSTHETPLLRRCLKSVLHVLIEKKMTLLEAVYLMSPIEVKVRKYLTHDIEDREMRAEWAYFNSLKTEEFNAQFFSTRNRMMEFLDSQNIKDIIGQTENTVDFRKLMDEGWIILVNLSPGRGQRIAREQGQLLGTLIINDLFMNALARPEGSKPFYVYIDECALLINEDIGYILDEGRKFGLHLTLAHQHLSQLKDAGERVYKSVMIDAKTKLIFGGISDPEDAELLTKQLYLGSPLIDLEQPKAILNKPQVMQYIKEWFKNYSTGVTQTEGGSEAIADGGSDSETDSTSRSVSETEDAEGNILTTEVIGSNLSNSLNTSHVKTSTANWSESITRNRGKAETLVPVLEERPTQVYSLQEQVWKAMGLLVNQPTQHAILKVPKQNPVFVKIPYCRKAYTSDERNEREIDACYKLTDFAIPRLLGKSRREKNALELMQKAGTWVSIPNKIKYPKDFGET